MNASSGLAQLLRHRGFIDLIPTRLGGGSKECSLASYGPLGTLLRQNILKKWWELMVATQSNVFPVESQTFTHQSQHLPSPDEGFTNSMKTSLQHDCVSQYPQVLKLTNGKLPFSIASVGACLSEDNNQRLSEETEESRLLLGSSIKTKMTLQNYVLPANANVIHDYWLRTRLSWWKKFSRSPERFSVSSESPSEVTSKEGKEDGSSSRSHTTSIVYDFPWGSEVVETVNNLGDRLLRQSPEEEAKSFMVKGAGKKPFFPSCIECETNIESAMASWLVDAYQERPNGTAPKKKSSVRKNQVLHLHPQLCPYQVAIVVAASSSSSPSSPSSSTGSEMRYVCDKLESDLTRAGVSVFNTSLHGGSQDAHFKRNDQLGVVYTVVINQGTLTDGLVNTRSRNTQIKVSSHISNLVVELVRNLNAHLE